MNQVPKQLGAPVVDDRETETSRETTSQAKKGETQIDFR